MAFSTVFIVWITFASAYATVALGQLPPLPQGCNAQVAVLLPCLPFVQAQSSDPSSSCCNALGGAVQNSPICLCALLNAPGAAATNGINPTLALLLPKRCNVNANPSQCNNSPPNAIPPPESPPYVVPPPYSPPYTVSPPYSPPYTVSPPNSPPSTVPLAPGSTRDQQLKQYDLAKQRDSSFVSSSRSGSSGPGLG